LASALRWQRRPVKLASAILVALMLALTASAEPSSVEPVHRLSITERETHFRLNGTSAGELRRQLDARRPPRATEHWHALTEARFETHVELKIGEEGCGFAALEVELEIITVMPRWRPRHSVSRQLEDRWQAMLAGLRRHEDGHRRHAVAAAQDLYQRLVELPPQPRCSEFEARVRAENSRTMIRLQLKTDVYDAFTGRGKTQGAEL
jgi:predicted secreted Zn-dependent protease